MNELDPHNERDNDINRVYKSFVLLGEVCQAIKLVEHGRQKQILRIHVIV